MTFTLTRDQFTAAKTRLISGDVTITADSGTLTAFGITVQYSYTEPILTLDILDYGGHFKFLVNSQIKDWFKS